MKAEALLQAAATIFAGVTSNPDYVPGNEKALGITCVENAFHLRDLIAQRLKAEAPISRPFCTCEEVPGDHARCPIHGES